MTRRKRPHRTIEHSLVARMGVSSREWACELRRCGLRARAMARGRPAGRLAGVLGFEYEHLHRQVGVLTIGAHERRDLATGQLLDRIDELRLHAVLPAQPRLANLVPLARLEQRLLGR